ncbi:MAG TPA: CocE/NonD family hydrolase, partial [Phycisphaerales bacterium]|nr:CocE/NonD family hydrolase [Phycisphaerales bacterium]
MRITLRAFSLSLSLVLAPMILGCSPTATTTLQGSWPAPRGPEGPPVLPVANEGVIVEYHRPVPMRDGVRLSATIYRPAAPGRYPVILSRTPYVKASVGQAGVDRRLKFVRAGYAWADVDVRGRGDSDGSFRPFFQEGEDGYDTIEWCGRQPWSTGKVGMVGGSYGGYVQLAAGVRRPPSLACLVPSVACPDPFVDGLLMGPTGLPGPLSVSWYQYTTGRMNQSSAATPWAQVFKHRPLITL